MTEVGARVDLDGRFCDVMSCDCDSKRDGWYG